MGKKIVSYLLLGSLGLFLLLEIWTERKIDSQVNKSLYVLKAVNQTFTEENIKVLSGSGYDFSPYAETMLAVETWRSKETTRVIATNDNLEYIAKQKMVQGAWFNRVQEKQNAKVAVLNRQASEQYFGTCDAVTNELTIDGQNYTVVGVVEDESEKPQLYIPYQSDSEISQIWVLLKNASEKQLLLTKLGYDAEEIEVFCMEDYQEVIQMRSKSMLFLTGLVLVIKLILFIKKKGRETGGMLLNFLKDHYFAESFRLLEKREVQKNLVMLAGSMFLICLICNVTWFSPVFPGACIKNSMEILSYYIQPEMAVSRYAGFNEWNAFSIVICFLFVNASLLLGIRKILIRSIEKQKETFG